VLDRENLVGSEERVEQRQTNEIDNPEKMTTAK
jgi:hypothetical protein